MNAAAPFAEATDAQYVALTTFRKNGTAVVTPLWAAMDAEHMVMWTVTDSWKVKRIRRDPRVLVQACDARGKKMFGQVVEGTAEILDAPGTERVRVAIKKKYGIVGVITVKLSELRRGKRGTVGLSITAS